MLGVMVWKLAMVTASGCSSRAGKTKDPRVTRSKGGTSFFAETASVLEVPPHRLSKCQATSTVGPTTSQEEPLRPKKQGS